VSTSPLKRVVSKKPFKFRDVEITEDPNSLVATLKTIDFAPFFVAVITNCSSTIFEISSSLYFLSEPLETFRFT